MLPALAEAMNGHARDPDGRERIPPGGSGPRCASATIAGEDGYGDGGGPGLAGQDGPLRAAAVPPRLLRGRLTRPRLRRCCCRCCRRLARGGPGGFPGPVLRPRPLLCSSGPEHLALHCPTGAVRWHLHWRDGLRGIKAFGGCAIQHTAGTNGSCPGPTESKDDARRSI